MDGHASKRAYANSHKKILVVGLLHGNKYHGETNFYPQISGYNIVTNAILVTFYISQIIYFTLVRQGCVGCQ